MCIMERNMTIPYIISVLSNILGDSQQIYICVYNFNCLKCFNWGVFPLYVQMPRGKNHKRSQAAKKREAERKVPIVEPQQVCSGH